ncbi:hypothetical protein [Nocardia altamirensis]|uniref:hypothetical protein n=1 Tax=Nocardia altamirensis TaxID=472158 RepID=UPI0008406DE1|nr:hypothetical protein [Nocardia altamirensis]
MSDYTVIRTHGVDIKYFPHSDYRSARRFMGTSINIAEFFGAKVTTAPATPRLCEMRTEAHSSTP